MRNAVWIIITILCIRYTISFAVYEIKNKNYSSGIFSLLLSGCALALSVIRVFI